MAVRVLGIDPGLGRVGYGIVERRGSALCAVEFGLIETPPIETGQRLVQIHSRILELLEAHQPQAMAIERLHFARNQTTAMDVARASGVVLLCAAHHGLGVAEFSPAQVKLSVVGQGNADKKQVQFMVRQILKLQSTPKPDDVADALAVAITHCLAFSVR